MELRRLFQQFGQRLATDARIGNQLAACSRARSKWRSQWTARGATSAEVIFDALVPNGVAEGTSAHPIGADATELDAWKASWNFALPSERTAVASSFVAAVARVEANFVLLPRMCAELAAAASSRGMPMAAVTPVLSSLDPKRFVPMCNSWLSVLSQYDGNALGGVEGIGGYPEVNAAAFRWLEDAERESASSAFSRHVPSDRFAVFCSWVVQTIEPARARGFDVTEKKYKDWPPMW